MKAKEPLINVFKVYLNIVSKLLHEAIRKGGAEGGVTNVDRNNVARGMLNTHLNNYRYQTLLLIKAIGKMKPKDKYLEIKIKN
jgi:hypothetical protein